VLGSANGSQPGPKSLQYGNLLGREMSENMEGEKGGHRKSGTKRGKIDVF
jgi:hypothetical protein